MNQEQQDLIDTRLKKVKKIIENRNETYSDCFKQISDLWSNTVGFFMDETDVKLCMAQLKIARLKQSHKNGELDEDSILDILGYVLLLKEGV